MTNLRAVLVLLLGLPDAAVTNTLTYGWLVLLTGIVGLGWLCKPRSGTLWGLSPDYLSLVVPACQLHRGLAPCAIPLRQHFAPTCAPPVIGLGIGLLVWLSPWNIPEPLSLWALGFVVAGKFGLLAVVTIDAFSNWRPQTACVPRVITPERKTSRKDGSPEPSARFQRLPNGSREPSTLTISCTDVIVGRTLIG